MKRIIITLITLIAASVLFAAQGGASAQTIKLGTLAPEGSIWHRIIRDMADEWQDVPGASIKVRIYPGGVAGDESDMVRKMRIGQLHAAALTGNGLAMKLLSARYSPCPTRPSTIPVNSSVACSSVLPGAIRASA